MAEGSTKKEYVKEIRTELTITELSISNTHKSVRVFYNIKKKMGAIEIVLLESSLFFKGTKAEAILGSLGNANQLLIQAIEVKEELKVEADDTIRELAQRT